MLAPPLIVARPGDNGTPPGGCMFTGESHPGDGPYACVSGKYLSIGSVRELARALDILLADEVADKVSALASALAEARTTLAGTVANAAEVAQELETRTEELEAARALIVELEEKLAKQPALEAVVAEFLTSTPPASANRPAGKVRT